MEGRLLGLKQIDCQQSSQGPSIRLSLSAAHTHTHPGGYEAFCSLTATDFSFILCPSEETAPSPSAAPSLPFYCSAFFPSSQEPYLHQPLFSWCQYITMGWNRRGARCRQPCMSIIAPSTKSDSDYCCCSKGRNISEIALAASRPRDVVLNPPQQVASTGLMKQTQFNMAELRFFKLYFLYLNNWICFPS